MSNSSCTVSVYDREIKKSEMLFKWIHIQMVSAKMRRLGKALRHKPRAPQIKGV